MILSNQGGRICTRELELEDLRNDRPIDTNRGGGKTVISRMDHTMGAAKIHDWINFFPPILGHFCPRFVQIAQMGVILPRLGLILPRIPPATPVLYSAVTNPFRGYVHTQNTPSPTPKYPFSWPDFESGQNELLCGQNGPHLGKMFEMWAKLF